MIAAPDIWHDDEGVWLEVEGALFGPYDTEEQADEAYLGILTLSASLEDEQ